MDARIHHDGEGGAVNPVIEEIYRTRVVHDADGQSYPLDSHVDAVEGAFLHRLIRSDPLILRTLEVGCAYGLSSLHICEALRGREGAWHTIVDPNQSTAWHGVGIANLARSDIGYFSLLEQPSEIALPALISQGAVLDLVFIDGWHTFDQTMVDLYFAARLVRVGGLIVVDDCDRVTVGKAVAYFEQYPNLERVTENAPSASSTTVGRVTRAALTPELARNLLPSRIYDSQYVRRRYPSMVALRKVDEDLRDWRWFRGF